MTTDKLEVWFDAEADLVSACRPRSFHDRNESKQLGNTLWSIADPLRGAMDADDSRNYLSFLFLRYLSDNYLTAVKKELGRGAYHAFGGAGAVASAGAAPPRIPRSEGTPHIGGSAARCGWARKAIRGRVGA